MENLEILSTRTYYNLSTDEAYTKAMTYLFETGQLNKAMEYESKNDE